MARRPTPPAPLTWKARMIASIKRNPIKWGTAVLGFLAVIPGGIAGANYLGGVSEPWWLLTHGGYREYQAPFIKVQTDHDTYLNYLKLRDARQALKDAKDDLQKNPNSSSAQRTTEYYEGVVKKYQDQLDKAAPK